MRSHGLMGPLPRLNRVAHKQEEKEEEEEDTHKKWGNSPPPKPAWAPISNGSGLNRKSGRYRNSRMLTSLHKNVNRSCACAASGPSIGVWNAKRRPVPSQCVWAENLGLNNNKYSSFFYKRDRKEGGGFTLVQSLTSAFRYMPSTRVGIDTKTWWNCRGVLKYDVIHVDNGVS